MVGTEHDISFEGNVVDTQLTDNYLSVKILGHDCIMVANSTSSVLIHVVSTE